MIYRPDVSKLQHDEDYLAIIEATRGKNVNAKRNAVMCIAKFFGKFLGLESIAMKAMLDLVEMDETVCVLAPQDFISIVTVNYLVHKE